MSGQTVLEKYLQESAKQTEEGIGDLVRVSVDYSGLASAISSRGTWMSSGFYLLRVDGDDTIRLSPDGGVSVRPPHSVSDSWFSFSQREPFCMLPPRIAMWVMGAFKRLGVRCTQESAGNVSASGQTVLEKYLE